jgi:DNA-binding NtrC family response regulator
MEAKSVLDGRRQDRESNEEARRAAEGHDAAQGKVKRLVELTLRLLNEIEQLKQTQELQSPDERHRLDLNEELRRFEIRMIRKALMHTGGHQTRAADLLGVKLSSLHEKIKRYGIKTNSFGQHNGAAGSAPRRQQRG